MSQLGTLADRILEAVRHAPGCQLDELVLSVPELTWNQVFLEVDRLTRTGQVRMTAMGKGTYTIWLSNKEKRPRPSQPLSCYAKKGATTVAVPGSLITQTDQGPRSESFCAAASGANKSCNPGPDGGRSGGWFRAFRSSYVT